MAGLLDLLNSEDGRFALGLLDAGSAKPVRAGFGSGLLQAMNGAEQWKQAQHDRLLKQQYLQAQMADMQAQQAQRQAQADELKRKQAAEAAFGQQLQGLLGQRNRAAMQAGGGPTVAASETLQRNPVDWGSLAMRNPQFVEQISKLAGAQDLGRPEVARVEETMDASGRPVKRQLSKYGLPIGADLEQWKAPVMSDQGGFINALDPVSMASLAMFKKTNSPDALLSASTARRGQDLSDARSRDKNKIDASAVGKVDWKQDTDGNWVGLPKEVGAGPVTPVTTTTPGKRAVQSGQAINIIDQAEKLIDKSTGSYIGAGVDLAARAIGQSTAGADAAAQLKALEGALMMAQPRMEGPQSNLDVNLYRQMAGQIGDSTVPHDMKKAALGTIRKLHEKYAVPTGGSSGATGGFKVLGRE